MAREDDSEVRARAEEALDQLLEVTVLLGADMARGLALQGLTEAKAHLLYTLGADGPLTQRALAAELGVTPRAVTTYVDELTAAGLVTREDHPTDRRATLVTPTAQGAGVVDGLVAGRSELALRLFRTLGLRDLERLTRSLGAVVDELRVLVEDDS